MPTVLIVTGDRDRALVAARQAEGAGWRSVLAASGAAACLAVQDAAIDVVLLDPVVLDLPATDLIRLLRGLPKAQALPILVLADAAMAETLLASALAAGADDLLRLPISDLDLSARLGHLHRLKAASDQLTEQVTYFGEALTVQAAEGRSLMANIPGAVLRVDGEGRVLFASKPVFDAVTAGEAFWTAAADPTVRCRLELAWQRLALTGSPFFLDGVYAAPDGEMAFFEVRGVPLVHRGRVTGGVLLVSDVSDHRQVELDLAISERFAKATLDALPVSIGILDDDGRVVSANQQWLNAMHQPCWVDAVVKVGDSYLDHCDSIAAGRPTAGIVADAIRQVIKETIPDFESGPLGHLGCASRWVVRVSRLSGQGNRRIILTIDDVTERHQAESALRASEARLGYLMTAAPIVMYVRSIEPEQRPFTYVGDNVRGLLGWEPAAFGRAGFWEEHVDQGDWLQMKADGAILRQQGSLTCLFRIRHADGNWRWLRDEMRLVSDGSGRPLEIVGSWQDVTEQKRVEEAGRQAQKMDAIGRLAGGIAHDFNNLLSVILSYAAFVHDGLPETHDLRPDVAEVIAAAERAETLTRQLLAFSRQQVFQPVAADLATVLQGVCRLLDRLIGEDIRLEVASPGEALPVWVDVGQIEQVIINLAVNARDAMSPGGILSLGAGTRRIADGEAARHPGLTPGDWIELRVGDTGTGIQPEVLDRIFEPFFTTKESGKGTGLGLATVYGIVKQSHGYVLVDSTPGVGTRFSVLLPRHAGSPATGEADRPLRISPAPHGGRRGRVLVVDDEAGLRELARRSLETAGYDVIAAASGAEVAALLADGSGGSLDVLLTDVIMPEMNGIAVAALVRRHFPGVRVVFMSGYTDDAVLRHGIEHDGVDILAKPITPHLLLNKMAAVLQTDPG